MTSRGPDWLTLDAREAGVARLITGPYGTRMAANMTTVRLCSGAQNGWSHYLKKS